MITQKLSQRMGSVSDNTASNSYSYTKLSPLNTFPVSREEQIDMLLKLQRSQEQSSRMLQALIDKPVGANDKQSDAGEILLETVKAARSHLRDLGAFARSTGYFTRN